MTDTYPCPAEGCDYGPKPKKSILGHYSGKRDSAHAGGYERARQLLTDASDGGSNGSSDGDTGSAGGDESTPPSGGPSGTDGTVTFPEADSDSSGGKDDGGCPNCGGATDTLEEGEWFKSPDTGNQWAKTDGGEQYCDSCDLIIDGDEVYR